ncbi:ribonuclease H-like domain-containing protein [Tanacetum coccineum]
MLSQYHKKLLAIAVKEKEELKTKLENFQSSSKGLSKLLNSQMSAKDKSRLGYGDQIHEGVLSYENEALESAFDSRSNDVEDSHVYDRFAKVEGMHAVPPPMTGIYMHPKSDFRIDESKFTYEILESVPKPAVNEPKVVSKPKVWSDAPIIDDESDNDDEYVIKPSKEQEKSNDPQKALKNKGIVDSGCSMHITGNKAYLVEYQDYNGGPVAFGGKLKQFNLFSESQMYDKKNKVIFTDSECLVLSPDFKLPDENQATVDESNKWHRRLGHVNFKFLNKLVKGNLVRGLPLKIFQNDQTCVACQKGKQHKASWKGPNWLFDLDYLTDSMNYQPATTENKANKVAGPKEANHSACTQDNIDVGNSKMETEPAQEYFVLPLWSSYTSTVKSPEAKNGGEKPNRHTDSKTNEEPVDQEDQAFLEELERLKRQEKEANDAAEAFRKEFTQCIEDLLLQAGAAGATSTYTVNIVSTPVSTSCPSRVFSTGGTSYPDQTNYANQDDS